MAKIRSSQVTASSGTLTAEPVSTALEPRPRPKVSGATRRKKAPTAALAAPFNPAVEQGVLLCGLGVCGFVALSLVSWHADDPSLSSTGAGAAQNMTGALGAVISDLLFQAFGYAAWSVLVVAAMIAVRLAGRRVGGVGSVVLGGVAFCLLAVGIELVAGAEGRAFPAGGLLGAAGVGALVPQLGDLGAGIAVGSALIASVTVLFGINWQPMFARAVDRVQTGVPLAARAVGSFGGAAVRAGASGVSALRDRLPGGRTDPDEDEPADDDAEDAEDLDPAEPPAPAPRTSPRLLTEDRPRVPEAPTRARVLPRRPDPPSLPDVPSVALPPPPSVWSARPPPELLPIDDIDRDAPTQHSGRSLVEVEWESTQAPPARPRPPAPAASAAPARPSRPEGGFDDALSDWAGGDRRAPPPAAPARASRTADPRTADPRTADPRTADPRTADSRAAEPRTAASVDAFERAPGDLEPASVVRAPRVSPAVVADDIDPPSVAPPRFAPPPRAVEAPPPRAVEPPPPRAVEPPPPRAAEPPARPRNGTTTAVLPGVSPGNLRSGGNHDDGRAVRRALTPYQLPPLALLDHHPEIVTGTDESVLHELAHTLTAKLLDFGVEGRVVAIRPGPVITLFEYEPAPGIKVSRISNLSDDLAMALKAMSVRIVAPIPGRGVVGIEIPNAKRQTVWARDVFASAEFRDQRNILPVVLGKDTEGKPYVGDLAKMPHLLVGGTTGSGKSVGVNGMLTSLLLTKSPEELRFILVDPKMLEFELYKDIPHLLHPVVTEPKLASAVLKWACVEMDERYRLLARWQTRNIEGYNERVVEETADWTPEKARKYAPKDWPSGDLLPVPKKLAYIVVVIDELADLMMVAAKDVEESIVRIAQKARACGIHLIVATQRPSVDVITGLIKANMPSRLAYQVRQKNDGRTILDQNGAETLLGKGDLLFLPPGTSGLLRAHAAFLTDDEVRRVTDHCRAQGAPDYAPAIKVEGGEMDPEELAAEKDENYDKALDYAIEKGKVSTSMIQRVLGIGYNRAAKIMEIMEQEGVVGPADGAKAREVLVQSR